MYIRKRSGPRTEPCGTPCEIVLVDESNPRIDTNCERLLRYEANQLLAVPRIP